MNQLPGNIQRAMHRQPVFKPYAKPAPPPAPAAAEPTPAQERWQAGEERKLNDLVYADLRRRGYFVIRSRTDKPTSQQRGIPDLIVCSNGRVVMIELKAANGKLSAVQRERHDELILAGVPVQTCWNFDDAIKFAVSNLPAIDFAREVLKL